MLYNMLTGPPIIQPNRKEETPLDAETDLIIELHGVTRLNRKSSLIESDDYLMMAHGQAAGRYYAGYYAGLSEGLRREGLRWGRLQNIIERSVSGWAIAKELGEIEHKEESRKQRWLGVTVAVMVGIGLLAWLALWMGWVE